MAPEVDRAFAAACERLCPGFRATGPYLPARKSRVLPGVVDGAGVVAKQLARANETWAWYLAREIAIYRAFAASPPACRVPALIAADEASGLLVIEHLRGERLAQRRHPAAELAPGTLDQLAAARDAIAAWPGAFPSEPPPAAVRRQLRARLLEDPTAPWVAPGLARAVALGILSRDEERRLAAALEACPGEARGHGDLLLRNAILVGDRVALVDWECAGTHPCDWDLALVWTQLGPRSRARLESVAGTSPERTAAFFALAAFALVREIAFARSFARGRASRSGRRLADELRATIARV